LSYRLAFALSLPARASLLNPAWIAGVPAACAPDRIAQSASSGAFFIVPLNALGQSSGHDRKSWREYRRQTAF